MIVFNLFKQLELNQKIKLNGIDGVGKKMIRGKYCKSALIGCSLFRI